MPNGCLKQRGSPQGPRRYDIRRDTHPASTDIAAPAEADPAEESTGAAVLAAVIWFISYNVNVLSWE